MKHLLERETSQKTIITDYLKSVKTHPSADKVYSEVKKKLPHISKGTVYRILSNLKEKNEIQAILYKGIVFYDGDTSDHAHFICQECQKIFDVFELCKGCGVIKNKKLKAGDIKNYKIYFYGICKCCKK